MSFFVDANIFLYGAMEGPARENCVRVLKAVGAQEVEGRTSASVLEEVWHVSGRSYPGQLDGLVDRAIAVFSPLVSVTEATLLRALSIEAPSLGTNDRVHVATCELEGIEVIVSSDAGFDEVGGIRRVDPFDADAVERLLSPAT
jgi:predicted nucleic acid-binding protein